MQDNAMRFIRFLGEECDNNKNYEVFKDVSKWSIKECEEVIEPVIIKRFIDSLNEDLNSAFEYYYTFLTYKLVDSNKIIIMQDIKQNRIYYYLDPDIVDEYKETLKAEKIRNNQNKFNRNTLMVTLGALVISTIFNILNLIFD